MSHLSATLTIKNGKFTCRPDTQDLIFDECRGHYICDAIIEMASGHGFTYTLEECETFEEEKWAITDEAIEFLNERSEGGEFMFWEGSFWFMGEGVELGE